MGNLWLTFSFLIGLSVGSFLNCIIYRLREGGSLWRGRSYCPKCKHKLGILDLIPVFSFIFLRGKCRYCHQKIFWQYPIVELIIGILFALTSYQLLTINNFIIHNSYPLILLKIWFFISVLMFIFIYDLKYYLIPDRIILPAIVIVLGINIVLQYSGVLEYGQVQWFRSTGVLSYPFGTILQYFPVWKYWLNSDCWFCSGIFNFLLAAALGGIFFLAQYLISKGQWVGGGDIRMGVLMGLILGWPNILGALFLAYVIGAIIGIGLIITGKKGWQSQVPFGPFLAGATIIILLLNS